MTLAIQTAALENPVIATVNSAKFLEVPDSPTPNIAIAKTLISTAVNSEQSISTPSTVASAGNSLSEKAQAEELLGAIWRALKTARIIGFLKRETNLFQNIRAIDVQDAIRKAIANSNAGSESFFAIAEYDSPDKRTAANAKGSYVFIFDLDVGEEKAATGKGYSSIEIADAALTEFCKKTGMPKPTHIVNSGGGLHVYFVLNNFVDRETWQKSAKMLKAVTKQVGFLADDTRTADIASVLRVPGTLNHKYNPPRKVELTYSSDNYIERDVMLTAIEAAHNRLCVTENVADKTNSTTHDNVGAGYTNAGTTAANMPETTLNIDNIKSALAAINPDCEREVWLKTCCALRSLNWLCGESLARAWSKGDYWTTTNQTATKYDAHAFDIMWRSIKSDAGISIGTLFHFAKEAGWVPAGFSQFDEFEVCETIIIEPNGKTVKQGEVAVGTQLVVSPKQSSLVLVKVNPLDQFSLRGKSAELEKNALAEVYVLEPIALQGEFTALFAAPGTGKTLVFLRLLVNGISEGRVNPNNVYYLNMDDSNNGVITKNRIAEQYNFHMLTEGRGFSALEFLPIMRTMIENDQAHGVVIILDTLKKFADVMDNTKTSIFTGVMRAFTMNGGTVIALAHTNKNADKSGKPVYGGVSSIMNDIDCAYTISEVSAADGVKVVAFEKSKSRGYVAQTAVYSYSIGNNIAYDDLLASVQFIDNAQLGTMKRAEVIKSASENIDIVLGCIAEGVNTKMELVDAFAQRAKMSKNSAVRFINQFTGADTASHKWNFTIGARGAKTFTVLAPSTPTTDADLPIAA